MSDLTRYTQSRAARDPEFAEGLEEGYGELKIGAPDRGDTLYVIETPNGIELPSCNPEFATQIEVAERVMREDRDVQRKLAK